MTAQQPQPEVSDRDAFGRFTEGNVIGRRGGRPPREIEREYLAAFTLGCPADRLQRIVEKLAEKAEAGNVDAIRLLLKHALPSQAMRVELDSVEQYRVAGASPAEHMGDMMARIQKKVTERRKFESRLRASGIQIGRKVSNKKSTGSRSRKKT